MSGERVPERKAKMNECRRGMDVGDRKQLGGTDQEVGRDSEAIQQETSDQIPTENITEDIGISPRGRGKWQRKTPEVQTETPEEDRTKLRRPDGTVGDVGGGVTGVRKMRTKCREVERFRNKGRRVGQSSGAMQQGRSDHIPTEIFGDIRKCGGPKAVTQPANCSSTREMSGTEGTETECSEGNFAKSCEGNRRRAPKIAGGANRGLEGTTKRDSQLSGASETQGRKVTEIRESRRKIWPGPGEDVWDFGKDARDPERPEWFSGASLGNRKSQNTIRTSVRVRASGDDNVGTTPERFGSRAGVEFPDGQPYEGELTGRYRVKAERQRKGSGTSRSDRFNRKVRVEAQGRRRGMSGSGGRAEWNQANLRVRNELQKSEGRGEEPRDFGDKTSEVSETTEMEKRKCQGIRDPKSVPESRSG
ncbi:hypothetical protein DFH06DRAFT_1143330 [Mycena polygramma]|nr:hypothetical protein DFH06DRAFT_1143330 [Mycena polygramma]